MKYGSVCSGIEAATVAWEPLGWTPAFFSEIDAAPRAVLHHRYPSVPLHGDFTTIQAGQYDAIDLLVGGTPCQDFSVAGKREGLDGDRGNLTLQYALLARRLRPRWFVWENVPGVFSNNAGRDFGAVLACFAGYPEGSIFAPPRDGWRNAGVVPPGPDGYGLAWRTLDAQYVRVDGFPRAVPQRRRRVFVVGYLGDWRPAAAVLLDREGLRGNPPPRRGAQARVAASITASLGRRRGQPDGADTEGHLIAGTLQSRGADRGGTMQDAAAGLLVAAYGGNDTRGPIDVATALRAKGGTGHGDFESETFVCAPVAQSLRGRDGARGVDSDCTDTVIAFNARQDPDVTGEISGALNTSSPQDQAIAFDTTQITSPHNRSNPQPGDPCHALAVGAHPPAVAFTVSAQANGFAWESEVSPTLQAQKHSDTSERQMGVRVGWAVRRLTPLEAERLQGFPDGYTLVPKWKRNTPLEDGPRYKALGNSMPVPVMRWIGRRIELVEEILREAA